MLAPGKVLRTGSSSSVKHDDSSWEVAQDGWDLARFLELDLGFGSLALSRLGRAPGWYPIPATSPVSYMEVPNV